MGGEAIVDAALETVAEQVRRTMFGQAPKPDVITFFHEPTFTATHVVADPGSGRAAIVDSVLDFDPASGRTSTESADAIVEFVSERRLTVDWLLETHLHADHLSAAGYLQSRLGGQLAIGREVTALQDHFAQLFNEDNSFARDGSQFDRLFDDGEAYVVGDIAAVALHVPGHTPADVAYVIGDAVFVGDTLFMPDYGTARTDFPGGDARQLYRSIRRLMRLPDETRVFLCHDYKTPARSEFVWETTMAGQRAGNIHIGAGIGEDEFVAMRIARDAALETPRLILPSVQVNMRGGRLPEPEANGTRYLKLPLNAL